MNTETIVEVEAGIRRVYHYNPATGEHVEASTVCYTEQTLRLEGRTYEWVAPKAMAALPAGSRRAP